VGWTTRTRTTAASLSALTAAAAAFAVTPLSAHATPGGPKSVDRIAGGNRYETAVLASQSLWPAWSDTSDKLKAHAVVLAKGEDYPDALGGIPLAGARQGPLLVTPGTGLDPGALAEIQRVLQPGVGKTVYVLGGPKALSTSVDDKIRSLGYAVHRIAGSDRYGTSLDIAHELGDPQRVVVATGTTFPDALSAGPLASMGGVGKPGAILLSDDMKLPPAVAAYIRPIIGSYPSNGVMSDTQQPVPLNPDHFVLAVGGHAVTAVRAAAASLPQQYSNFDTHENFGHVAGADRYATSCVAATWWSKTGNTPTAFGVATGANFPDALGGGAAIAQLPGPLLLTPPNALPQCAVDQLKADKAQVNWVEIYGGPAVVPSGIENQLHQIVGF
jgi:hypothetical protein